MGGTITSLMVVGVSWMAVFVILGDLESDSLLVSKPQETHKKMNTETETYLRK